MSAKSEKRSKSKSPYAIRPQLDVATGYQTSNAFYSHEMLNPNQDAREITQGAYSKAISELSAGDILRRYESTDLFNKV